MGKSFVGLMGDDRRKGRNARIENRHMRSVISVVQRKGGAGKTTIAISLAGDLHHRGILVDVIDADPQRSAAEWAAPGRLPFRVSEVPLRYGEAARWARLVGSSPG